MAKRLHEEEALTKIFKKYDTNNSHKLEEDQVKQLLTDLDYSTAPGTEPSEEELHFIIMLCDSKRSNGCIDRSELKDAINAWKAYLAQRDNMTLALNKYDVSGTGKLEREEIKAYLTDLNSGIEVTEQ